MPSRYSPPPAFATDWAWPREALFATAAMLAAVLVGMACERWIGFHDVALVFITAVIVVAVRSAMGVAVYAAVLGFLAYNFFFIAPRYTFYIAAPQGMATVTMFLLAALVCGRLASRLRAQLLLQRAATAQSAARQALAQRLAAAADEVEAVRAAADALHHGLGAEIAIFLLDPADGQLRESADGGGNPRFDPVLRVAAQQCLARLRGEAVPDADIDRLSWRALPITLESQVLGVACLRFAHPLPALPADLGGLAEAMLRDLAQALTRVRLVGQLESTRVQAETERLRAALLSSVSHDLRSPLSTIIGSAESLSLYRDRLSAEDQAALAENILREGQRLDRYIQNLLDMTRLGHRPQAIAREWLDLDELCGDAAARLRKHYPDARLVVSVAAPAPLVHGHPALLEQALFNLLDNAAKYSPPGAAITLRAHADGDHLVLDVVDRGPGIAAADRERVFEPFFRSDRAGRDRPGTGLGLGICRSIIAAHGGEVSVHAGDDGVGTCLRIRLPLTPAPAGPPKED